MELGTSRMTPVPAEAGPAEQQPTAPASSPVSGARGRGAARQRIVGRAVAGLVAAALLSGLFVVKISSAMPDFAVYRRAASRARSAEAPYQAADGHYQFKYLPAFALVAVPIGMLPEPVARPLWYAGSLGLLAGLLGLSLLTVPDRRKTGAFLLGATFLLMAKFYAHDLQLGQVNVLLAFTIVAAARLMQTGHESAAGLVMAAAVVVKPYALLFAPYVLARGRIASIASMASGVALALLAPAVVYGLE